jgi:hypothetical protein
MLGHRFLPVPADPSTWFGVTSQLEPCSLYISCGIDEETDEPFAIVRFGKHRSGHPAATPTGNGPDQPG